MAVIEFQRELVATGDEEIIPAEVANSLIDESNPIRVCRDFRGIKVIELAKIVNTSRNYISSIENGQREPSVSLLKNWPYIHTREAHYLS